MVVLGLLRLVLEVEEEEEVVALLLHHSDWLEDALGDVTAELAPGRSLGHEEEEEGWKRGRGKREREAAAAGE